MKTLNEYMTIRGWEEDLDETQDRVVSALEHVANIPLGKAVKRGLLAAALFYGVKGCKALHDEDVEFGMKSLESRNYQVVQRKIPQLHGYDAMLTRNMGINELRVGRIHEDLDAWYNAKEGRIFATDSNGNGTIKRIEVERLSKDSRLRKITANDLDAVLKALNKQLEIRNQVHTR